MKKSKRLILLLVGVILFYILFKVVNLRLHGYNDFTKNWEEIKSSLFNDSIKDFIRTDVTKRNINDDTLLCYRYKNEYLIVCLKINNFKSIQPSRIRISGPQTLDIKSGPYYNFIGSYDYPVKFAIAHSIERTSEMKLTFQVKDTTCYSLSSDSGILLNLVCSDIGVFTSRSTPDILIEPKQSRLSQTLILSNTIRGFYILGFFPIADDTVTTSKILPLLNPKTFDFKNAKYNRISG